MVVILHIGAVHLQQPPAPEVAQPLQRPGQAATVGEHPDLGGQLLEIVFEESLQNGLLRRVGKRPQEVSAEDDDSRLSGQHTDALRVQPPGLHIPEQHVGYFADLMFDLHFHGIRFSVPTRFVRATDDSKYLLRKS